MGKVFVQTKSDEPVPNCFVAVSRVTLCEDHYWMYNLINIEVALTLAWHVDIFWG